jgi:hypothetical protein
MRWTCIKGELRQALLLDLPSATKATRLDDGTLLTMPGPAISLDFHRNRKDVFLVGTEDGKIYKASINDPGIIDMTFDAHDFAVYSVQWRLSVCIILIHLFRFFTVLIIRIFLLPVQLMGQ